MNIFPVQNLFVKINDFIGFTTNCLGNHMFTKVRLPAISTIHFSVKRSFLLNHINEQSNCKIQQTKDKFGRGKFPVPSTRHYNSNFTESYSKLICDSVVTRHISGLQFFPYQDLHIKGASY